VEAVEGKRGNKLHFTATIIEIRREVPRLLLYVSIASIQPKKREY
jgi:hypothetical protein